MNITKKDICIGLFVEIVQYDERSNETYHRGYIKRIVTQGKSDKVKVELDNGEIGVVIHIFSKEELQLESFKFYNRLLFSKEIYVIWNRYEQYHFVQNSHDTKVLYLFQSKDEANKFIKKYLNDNFMVQSIKKEKKSLEQIFSKTDFNTYYIDLSRRISRKKLFQFEEKLRKQ